MTPDALLSSHAAAVAFVVEGEPATTLGVLAEQSVTATARLEEAGVDADDLSRAAVYLRDACTTEGAGRRTLLKMAHEYLSAAEEAVQEYRLML